MQSSRRSPSPHSYRRSEHSDRRRDYGKGRQQDNGWAGRRNRDEDVEDRPRPRIRSRSHSEDAKGDRSRRKDDHRDSRRGPGRTGRESRSRSPPRKRRRSRSAEGSHASGRRRHEDDHRDRDRRRGHATDENEHRDENALVMRERHLAPKSRDRSRSRSMDSEDRKAEERRKPNWGQSGLLAAATNTVQRADGSATVLKYNEPPEARKPVESWRLYEFKDDDITAMLPINRQSVYLFGRDVAVVDIPLDHPSCSKQHAALQYRYIVEKNEYGEKRGAVKPFIIDLESTNGTHINGETIPTARYYELKLSDVIKFGTSSREFVLLHESAAE